MKRKRGSWKRPSEIQNYPNAARQRIQVRLPDGRCAIRRTGQVDWGEVTEWRWA